MTTLAEQLGGYAADLKFEDLPPEVIHQARRMIVDTLGCALGGFDSEPTRIALEQAATVTSTRPATILCTGQQTSPDLAVFPNGVMIRYLDFNDGHIGREAGHPSESIAALSERDAIDSLKRQGLDATGGSPEAFVVHIKTELAKWAKVVKDANIKAD